MAATRAQPSLTAVSMDALARWCGAVSEARCHDDAQREATLGALLVLRDRRFDLGGKKRSSLVAAVDRALRRVLRSVPELGSSARSRHRRVDAASRAALRPPERDEELLIVDAAAFLPEGAKGNPSQDLWLLRKL